VKKMLLFVAVFAISGALGIPLLLPASPVRKVPAQAPVLVGARADDQVFSIIQRSCQNCHSWKTEWPLYSRIFPFSWMIEHDVETARGHMNLSRWQTYDDSEKRLMLAQIGVMVRNHVMPPRRYTLIHPEAKLSEAEVNSIYRWTHVDRGLPSHSPEE